MLRTFFHGSEKQDGPHEFQSVARKSLIREQARHHHPHMRLARDRFHPKQVSPCVGCVRVEAIYEIKEMHS